MAVGDGPAGLARARARRVRRDRPRHRSCPACPATGSLEQLRAGATRRRCCCSRPRTASSTRPTASTCGADGYLLKPFSFVVLVAQLRALLRRRGVRGAAGCVLGPLVVDPVRAGSCRGPRDRAVAAREFALLHALMRRPGERVSKDELLATCGATRAAAPQRRRGLRRLPAPQARRGRRGRPHDGPRARVQRRAPAMSSPSGRAGPPRLRGWWARRGLRTRITLAVALVAVVVLLALARLWVGLLLSAVVAAGDGELRDRADDGGRRRGRGRLPAAGGARRGPRGHPGRRARAAPARSGAGARARGRRAR